MHRGGGTIVGGIDHRTNGMGSAVCFTLRRRLVAFVIFFLFFAAAIQVSRRFLVSSARPLSDSERAAFVALVHDRMTEMEYSK